MAIAVEVPKLGNSVEECLISRWCKQRGDVVSAGDVVAEIETDKATFEVTAPEAGTVLATFFDEGALVPVFTRLFVIGQPGESIEEPEHGGAAQAVEPAPTQRTAPEVPRSADVSQPANGTAISPRARRFAAQNGITIPKMAGSGPGGRILEVDLRTLTAKAPRVSGVRERIARRMRESLASTAQYTMHASAEATALLAARARVGKDININHLVAFCTVETLLEIPALNSEFVDGSIRQHDEVHLGFACDTPRGLLVPVVRNADALCIDELAARMKELAEQAVAGAIATDDLSGATFTISNLGLLGIEAFTPLLNPPQVAILGVGAIQLKPVRRAGQIEFVDAIGLSLTCDHQVIDGAPGARFLQALKRQLENVLSLI